uniref:Allorecognition 1 n=1 Tax=Hydractinia symbiolongicarpus TaxID=13093 RepID=D9ZHU2_HYDSY|nr:allorecognition 1 [Hydractinia symbiolongicarpus]
MLEIMKRVAIVAVGIALCLMNFSFAADVTTSTPVLEATYGTTVNMQWKITLDTNQVISFINVKLKSPPGDQIISGGANSQNILNKGREFFGSRLSAVYDKITSIYTVSIKNIQYNESLSFQLITTMDNPFFAKQAAIEIKNVTGMPRFCGENFKSNYTVLETTSLMVEQDICGHPKPNAVWKLEDDSTFSNSFNSSLISNETRRYRYIFNVKNIKRLHCGKQILLNATNKFGNDAKESILYVEFTPSKILNLESFTVNKSCIFTHWDKENTGKCVITYHVQFNNKKDAFNTNNLNYTYCHSNEDSNASTVTVWASYNGARGENNTASIATTTPSPTTTQSKVITSKTTSNTKTTKGNVGVTTSSPDKGSNIGLIVGIVGGILFVIVIIIIIVCVLKHKKKNGTGNHSEYAMRVRGEENNYVTDPTRSNGRQPVNPDDPEQAIYSELGPGGGRTGPRPAPEQSDYAEMKVDAMGYPIDGAKASEPPTYAPVIKPREGAKRRTPSPRSNVDGARAAASSEPPAYAPIMKNRSSSRGRSPPPDEDDHEGVIV